ncbi:MAG: succinate--CoA ligase subunit beta, partial [Bacteroidales bacterium]|nr:succinate--CoA ligase subunit beta [Bacteroidales bacterium]
MNIHEYQAKSILKQFGVAVPEGVVIEDAEKAVEAAKQIQEKTGMDTWAVKAQIHAGGRGKGGGVKIAKSLKDVKKYASDIIGMNLVTHQTGPEGKKVNKVLVEQGIYYPGESEVEEFYLSVLLNRGTGRNIIMYSTEGGMDIETVAEKTPHLIYKEEIDPKVGIQAYQARKVAFNLGLSGNAFKQMVKFVIALYSAYEESDASLFEINPVL